MIKMNEEELNNIQELIERKLLMAEVMGGLTSQDKKFINLWNYAIQLQNNWNNLKQKLEKTIKAIESESLINFKKEKNCYQKVLNQMLEMEKENE